MADDAQSIRSLNWRELFPFLNIFRSFGIAIHPSKLMLGFALLILIYLGGRFLDLLWPARHYAAPTEIELYDEVRWSHDPASSFESSRDKVVRDNAIAYSEMLRASQIVKEEMPSLEAALVGEHHSDLQVSIVGHRNEDLRTAVGTYFASLQAAKVAHEKFQKNPKDPEGLTDKDYPLALRGIENTYAHADAAAKKKALDAIRHLNEITPRPIFDTFFEYEVHQFHYIVQSALTWNWLNGVGGVAKPIEGVATVGVVRSIVNFGIIGPSWLLCYHFIYFIIFIAWCLVVWAIFGGAIARIAAVHIARDEKISVTQALRFSFNKVLSFVFAPLIPLIIILVAGVLVGAGGLLLYLPMIGPILVGALFILALLAGFVMTLVATGTVGGFNLMYPTIAVEGSDSFDAISRSFSYVFGRPWKKLFYSAVAIIYGAICFLFVRYFVYVMLSLTHFFVQWFLAGRANYYWPEIWPPVSDQNLAYQINFQALAWSEKFGAVLIAMWIYAVLTLLAGFVISFYFSANTIIYYLMRREVDATEMDDVYVEETEDDFTEAAAAPTTPVAAAAPAATPVAASPAAEAPPAASPAPEASPPPA